MIFELKQIATIRSPFCDLVNMPVQPKGARDIYATIEFEKKYEEGLKDLNGFSHVYLIYHFHKVKAPKLSVIPFNDKTNTTRGVFSTRTPMHPNGLGRENKTSGFVFIQIPSKTHFLRKLRFPLSL